MDPADRREPAFPSGPAVAFYGDDFTGATDTLATATAAGLRTLLFLRVPDDALLAAAGPLDVLGIAGASRSMAPDAMRAALAPVRDCFARLAPRIVHYKVCSTFDSAPGIGNIAVAVETLRPLAPQRPVIVVGGQPNLDRYCLFGHLFAAGTTGGEVYRLDRHPTMRRHPVTPMGEADLRVHLGRQGLGPMHLIAYTGFDAGAQALLERQRGLDGAARDDRCVGETPAATLIDVSHPRDLPVIGALLWRLASEAPLLVVGPSGATQALAAAWPHAAWPHAARTAPVAVDPTPPPAAGPVLLIAGSLSPVTRRQRDAASRYRRLDLDAARLATAGPDGVRAPLAEAIRALRDGRHVLLSTAPVSAPADAPANAPANASADPVADATPRADPSLAQATGKLLRKLLAEVPAVRRVGIAGGDTASHAVAALDLWALGWQGQLAPGVPLCRARSADPALDGLELMLKGGQMGQVDLFDRLVG